MLDRKYLEDKLYLERLDDSQLSFVLQQFELIQQNSDKVCIGNDILLMEIILANYKHESIGKKSFNIYTMIKQGLLTTTKELDDELRSILQKKVTVLLDVDTQLKGIIKSLIMIGYNYLSGTLTKDVALTSLSKTKLQLENLISENKDKVTKVILSYLQIIELYVTELMIFDNDEYTVITLDALQVFVSKMKVSDDMRKSKSKGK